MNTLYLGKAGFVPNRRTSENQARQHISGFLGALLVAILCFTTVTVWVQENWALQCFQIGIYALVIVQVLMGIHNPYEGVVWEIKPLLIYSIPLWGIIQLHCHITASSFVTRGEVLRWGALSGVFYLTRTAVRSHSSRRRFLIAFLCFATAMAILCLMQLNTSHGKILWVVETRFTDIYATFQNKNSFGQFVELALPLAVWGAVRRGWRSWWYVLAAGILYAATISVSSRAAFVLCTAELIAIPAIGLARLRERGTRSSVASIASMVLIVPAVAVAFTFAVGWGPTLERFHSGDPYAIRHEFLLGAIDMAEHRPLTGYGLGMFVHVYQRYTIKDFPFDATHAHNDWAEFAADGGIPFLLLIGIPFFGAIPSAIRHPWALGLVATILNAFVDFPFPRPAVSAWMFALLAILYTTSRLERANAGNSEIRAGGPQIEPAG